MEAFVLRFFHMFLITVIAFTTTIPQTIAAHEDFSCDNVMEIPIIECEALAALYHNTGGDQWTEHTGWLTSDTPSGWTGVWVVDGHVSMLYLRNQFLTGSIPPELGNLAGLQQLDLSDNELVGTIPDPLGELSHLQGLFLNNNELSGSIPDTLCNLAHLGWLYLDFNQISGSIPPGIGNLTRLSELDLSQNEISGEIPPDIANLSGLTKLNLSINQISGSIPPQFGNLVHLEYLNLDRNRLSGSIPPELGSLQNLTGLRLSRNSLSGSIPHEFGQLENLITLDLYHNQLSGPLPVEISRLAYLNGLLLSHNDLTGEIPPELAKLTQLQVLELEYNWLTVPDPYPSSPPTPLETFLMTLDRGWEKTQGVRTAIPLSGGSLQSADARVRIAIPEAGIAQPVTFQLTTLGQPGAVRSHFGFAHTSFMLAALDDHGNPIKPFVYLLPVRMTLMYQDTDIITLKEDQLILYEWNTDSSSWQDAAQSCTPASSYNRDMENHLLSVDVCQGFLFALMSEYQHSVFLPWIKQP